jgi:hypothetical protein
MITGRKIGNKFEYSIIFYINIKIEKQCKEFFLCEGDEEDG